MKQRTFTATGPTWSLGAACVRVGHQRKKMGPNDAARRNICAVRADLTYKKKQVIELILAVRAIPDGPKVHNFYPEANLLSLSLSKVYVLSYASRKHFDSCLTINYVKHIRNIQWLVLSLMSTSCDLVRLHLLRYSSFVRGLAGLSDDAQ